MNIPPTLEPGHYELRLFSKGTWQCLATTAPFQVLSSIAGIELIATKVKPGDQVTVKWHDVAEPSKDHWIGIFPAGHSDQAPLTVVATGGGTSGTVLIQISPSLQPGRYELRLFSKGSWKSMAASEPFELGNAK